MTGNGFIPPNQLDSAGIYVSNIRPPEAPPSWRQLYSLQETLREAGLIRNTPHPTMLSRGAFATALGDPRRDLDAECGYPPAPQQISTELYKELYDRFSIAARVVEVMPEESWQGMPTVYEEEEGDKATDFEEAWDALGQDITPGGSNSWYKEEEGSPVWTYLQRADILAGIGHFGVLLLGVDDGRNLSEPIDGVVAVPEGNPPLGSITQGYGFGGVQGAGFARVQHLDEALPNMNAFCPGKGAEDNSCSSRGGESEYGFSLGGNRVYHGTTADCIDSVFSDGLKAHQAKDEDRPPSVFFSGDREVASDYVSHHGKKGVVFEIDLTDDIRGGAIADEEDQPRGIDAWRVERDIPKECIKGVFIPAMGGKSWKYKSNPNYVVRNSSSAPRVAYAPILVSPTDSFQENAAPAAVEYRCTGLPTLNSRQYSLNCRVKEALARAGDFLSAQGSIGTIYLKGAHAWFVGDNADYELVEETLKDVPPILRVTCRAEQLPSPNRIAWEKVYPRPVRAMPDAYMTENEEKSLLELKGLTIGEKAAISQWKGVRNQVMKGVPSEERVLLVESTNAASDEVHNAAKSGRRPSRGKTRSVQPKSDGLQGTYPPDRPGPTGHFTGDNADQQQGGSYAPPPGPFVEGTDRQYDAMAGASSVGAAFGGMNTYPGTELSGTDQQYFGVQFGPSERLSDTPAKGKRRLLFLRAFDESLVQIVRYEWNIRNPRFGLPVMYRITLNDPRETHSGVGLPLATVFVHWSRVIHIADNLRSSEIFGVPRMRPVLNDLLDLRKIYGGSGEGYWQTVFSILQFATHPQLGGDVIIDKTQVQDTVNSIVNGLQRYVMGRGGQWSTLSPTVQDPTSHVTVRLEAICIKLGMPVRIFKGSERGELASSQDDSTWNDRKRERQRGFITPRILVPFIDRLIQIGVLPEPKDGYYIKWPDLEALGDKDKATILQTKVTAYAAYVAGNLEAMIPPHEFMTKFDDLDEDTAEAILDAAKKSHESQETMTMPAQIGGHDAEAPEGSQDAADQEKSDQKYQDSQDMQQKKFAAAQKAQQGGGDDEEDEDEGGDKGKGKPPGGGNPGNAGGSEGVGQKGTTGNLRANREAEGEDGFFRGYEDQLLNRFCPTGPGGGIDPSCGVEGATAGGHPEGTLGGDGSKEKPYICGENIKVAAKLLAAGHHIELNQREQVSTLTDRLSKMINKAVASGKPPPKFDLCKVSVPDTNLFCQETKGVPRINMPQMRGQPTPGTPSAAKPVNKAGKVDVGQEFIADLRSRGIGVEETKVKASVLRASQSEIDGARVVQLVDAVKHEGKDLKERPIYITRDNYVLDGHHHWAALVAVGGGEKDHKIPVYKLDMEIGRGIDEANSFAKKMGLKPKSVATANVALLSDDDWLLVAAMEGV